MNPKKIIILCALLLLLGVSPAVARVCHLLPKPRQVNIKVEGKYFALGRKVCVNDPTQCALLREFLEDNGCTIVEKTKARIEVKLVEKIAGATDYELAGYENEAYRIDVTEQRVNIEAVTPTGVIRAVQTLQQMAEGYKHRTGLELVEIIDYPAFKLRGFMHDVGRQFIPVDELKKQIRLLSRFKVNTLHLHLTDNPAWRFEVTTYPQLTSAASMTRDAGSFYTQEECRELEEYALRHGMTIIPEIDMPGHSAAFKRAMGVDMQSTQGIAQLKTVLTEVVATFEHAPYIHIGADEVNITNPEFLGKIIDWVHSLGRKVVVWRPSGGNPQNVDMAHMWGSTGKPMPGAANIDSRYLYLNHFDVFADLAGAYLSNIYHQQEGSKDVVGAIAAVWNDHRLASTEDIVRENNLYANVVAMASRAWTGGGKEYIETTGARLPNEGPEFEDFKDWESRFLFHKMMSLRDEPIPYVAQSHVRWMVCGPFPNGGDPSVVLPPERQGPQNGYLFEGKRYEPQLATGATIYLRHGWSDRIPALYKGIDNSGYTAYAWTYVYSEREQKVGALIELQNYSRSRAERVPEYVKWDRKGSRIWLNDVEVLAPLWKHHGEIVPLETPLGDVNMTSRPPLVLHLEKGWNKVFMKLPYVPVEGIQLNKWMFTFVFTDVEGRYALPLEYDPGHREMKDER